MLTKTGGNKSVHFERIRIPRLPHATFGGWTHENTVDGRDLSPGTNDGTRYIRFADMRESMYSKKLSATWHDAAKLFFRIQVELMSVLNTRGTRTFRTCGIDLGRRSYQPDLSLLKTRLHLL